MRVHWKCPWSGTSALCGGGQALDGMVRLAAPPPPLPPRDTLSFALALPSPVALPFPLVFALVFFFFWDVSKSSSSSSLSGNPWSKLALLAADIPTLLVGHARAEENRSLGVAHEREFCGVIRFRCSHSKQLGGRKWVRVGEEARAVQSEVH